MKNSIKYFIIAVLSFSAASAENLDDHKSSLSIELFPIMNVVTYSYSYAEHFAVGVSPFALNYTLGTGVKSLLDPPLFLSLSYQTEKSFSQDSLYLKGTILLPKRPKKSVYIIPEFGARYAFSDSYYVNFGFAMHFEKEISLDTKDFRFLPLPTLSFGKAF